MHEQKRTHQKTSWASSQLNSLHAKPQTLDDAETPRGNVVYRALFSSQSRAQSAQSEPCMDETGLSGRCRESGIQALLARPVNSVSGVRPRCSDFGPPASTPCLARMHGVLSLTLWQLARLAGHTRAEERPSDAADAGSWELGERELPERRSCPPVSGFCHARAERALLVLPAESATASIDRQNVPF